MGPLDAGDGTAYVDRISLVQEVKDARVGRLSGAIDMMRLQLPVRDPLRFDGHGGDDHAFTVTEGNPVARGQPIGKPLLDIEDDGNCPDESISQSAFGNDPIIVLAI